MQREAVVTGVVYVYFKIPLEKADEAHKRLFESKAAGKVVLIV